MRPSDTLAVVLPLFVMPPKLTSPSEIGRLLREHGVRPTKRLGQNFLADANTLSKIVSAAAIAPDDCVLEIGPGLGALTVAAAEAAAMVVCVEVDRRLVSVLGETLAGIENVQVVQADFLSLDIPKFCKENFGQRRCILLANLPYCITSPAISAVVEARTNFTRAVLMVQKEVADRLTASPGERDYGSFGIYVNFHWLVEVIAEVPKTVFIPAPEVNSAIVRMTPRESPAVAVKDEAAFGAVVRAAFQQRRKTLTNALAGAKALRIDRETAARILSLAGVDASRRGETLSMAEFAAVADRLSDLL